MIECDLYLTIMKASLQIKSFFIECNFGPYNFDKAEV